MQSPKFRKARDRIYTTELLPSAVMRFRDDWGIPFPSAMGELIVATRLPSKMRFATSGYVCAIRRRYECNGGGDRGCNSPRVSRYGRRVYIVRFHPISGLSGPFDRRSVNSSDAHRYSLSTNRGDGCWDVGAISAQYRGCAEWFHRSPLQFPVLSGGSSSARSSKKPSAVTDSRSLKRSSRSRMLRDAAVLKGLAVALEREVKGVDVQACFLKNKQCLSVLF